MWSGSTASGLSVGAAGDEPRPVTGVETARNSLARAGVAGFVEPRLVLRERGAEGVVGVDPD